MKRGEYYRGRNGRKYGIWNTAKKCFQFGIAEDTPMLAEASLIHWITFIPLAVLIQVIR